MSPAQKAATLNTASEPIAQRVTIQQLQTYMFDQGLDVAIENESVTATPYNTATQAICKRMMSLFTSKVIDTDVAHTDFQTGIANLVTATLMTQAQADAITAMGTKLQSPSELVGWGGMSNSLLADWITKVGA